MNFVPLEDEQDIKQAFALLSNNFRENTRTVPNVHVGWRGGAGNFDVLWHDLYKYWVLLQPEGAADRYWCAYGTKNPEKKGNHGITVEINPPKAGLDLRCGGAFLRDIAGRIYLAHSGRVGGGRKGIGKSAFLGFCQGCNTQAIGRRDRKEAEMIVIGCVDDPRLLAQIGQYVNEVERFKQAATYGTPRETEQNRKPEGSFNPEFSGSRRPYSHEGEVASSCDHGVVVNRLHKLLEETQKLKPYNDRCRDLYIKGNAGETAVLLEVKTDLSLGSIYQGIGQLSFNSALEPQIPRLVLVIPGSPSKRTAGRLTKLGIRVLSYTWHGNEPVFSNLDRVLN